MNEEQYADVMGALRANDKEHEYKGRNACVSGKYSRLVE